MSRKHRQIRLFVGVKVSMETVKALAEAAESMRREAYDAGYQIRWVAPASYHITLKFLGWAQPEILTAIGDRLAPRLEELSSFEISTGGLGAFPDKANARVIWAGVDDPEGHLAGIASTLEDELCDLGFAKEKRPYHAHITLGRVKRVDDISTLLHRVPEQKFRSTRVDRVTLFESVMKSKGSEYASLAEWRFLTRRADAKRQTQPVQQSREQQPAHSQETSSNGSGNGSGNGSENGSGNGSGNDPANDPEDASQPVHEKPIPPGESTAMEETPELAVQESSGTRSDL